MSVESSAPCTSRPCRPEPPEAPEGPPSPEADAPDEPAGSEVGACMSGGACMWESGGFEPLRSYDLGLLSHLAR